MPLCPAGAPRPGSPAAAPPPRPQARSAPTAAIDATPARTFRSPAMLPLLLHSQTYERDTNCRRRVQPFVSTPTKSATPATRAAWPPTAGWSSSARWCAAPNVQHPSPEAGGDATPPDRAGRQHQPVADQPADPGDPRSRVIVAGDEAVGGAGKERDLRAGDGLVPGRRDRCPSQSASTSAALRRSRIPALRRRRRPANGRVSGSPRPSRWVA